jgi:hypothetical protein
MEDRAVRAKERSYKNLGCPRRIGRAIRFGLDRGKSLFPWEKAPERRRDVAKSMNRKSFSTLRDDPNLIILFQ